MNANSRRFEEIALKYIDVVFRVAIGLCGRRADADDLVQDTFLKAYEKFETFEQGTNLKAWLLTILRNTWTDRLRHKKVVGSVVSLNDEIIEQSGNTIEDIELSHDELLERFSDEEIINALKELPSEQRVTLLLLDVEQMSQMETAEITGVAVGTVKSRASRGRMALKNFLNSYAKEIGFTGGEK